MRGTRLLTIWIRISHGSYHKMILMHFSHRHQGLLVIHINLLQESEWQCHLNNRWWGIRDCENGTDSWATPGQCGCDGDCCGVPGCAPGLGPVGDCSKGSVAVAANGSPLCPIPGPRDWGLTLGPDVTKCNFNVYNIKDVFPFKFTPLVRCHLLVYQAVQSIEYTQDVRRTLCRDYNMLYLQVQETEV
jgi:hypothetical protein